MAFYCCRSFHHLTDFVRLPGQQLDEHALLLLPLDEEGQNHDGEVYLYSFTRTAEGAPMLSNIESDEEYNKAAIAFDTVLQNAREAEAAGTPLE